MSKLKTQLNKLEKRLSALRRGKHGEWLEFDDNKEEELTARVEELERLIDGTDEV